ncbi:hypothetical protein [Spartinivicinus poritis]|uniref:Uncharacterized protein n=1 Tax=Spartinivicinus poritis TaxID=2994640 RepID=A0ABT5U2S1_9GAMM|nr:hypothetical protein [Spartinivicinus sp. A2-2]MDE1460656.1 hypothetical protein [Spartinivicinus sp. A2-2]
MQGLICRLLFWSLFGAFIGLFIGGKSAYGEVNIYVVYAITGAVIGSIFGQLFYNLGKRDY